MKRFLILATISLAIGCSTTTKPPVTPQPPTPPSQTQTWTNALRLPAGQMSPGVAIYLPAPASLSLNRVLADAGAQKRSTTAWTISVLDLNDARHMQALTAVGHAGGHVRQHVVP